MSMNNAFLDQAIALAFENVEQGGRPFGAVVVKTKRSSPRASTACRQIAIQLPMPNYWHCAQQAKYCSPRVSTVAVFMQAASPAPCVLLPCACQALPKSYSPIQTTRLPLQSLDGKIAEELSRPISEQTGIKVERCSLTMANGSIAHGRKKNSQSAR